MAHIETDVDDCLDLTVHRFIGHIDVDDIIQKIHDRLDQPLTRLVIWDFTHAHADDVSVDQLQDIVNVGKRLSHTRKCGKIAIVVKRDLAFGLGRMYGAYTEMESFPTESRVFRTLGQARQWLGVPC